MINKTISLILAVVLMAVPKVKYPETNERIIYRGMKKIWLNRIELKLIGVKIRGGSPKRRNPPKISKLLSACFVLSN